MLLKTPVQMVHMLYSSLLQAKANLCHCLASSRRGSKFSLSWKHPVSVENSAVQQSVLKYIIYINLNSGLIVIGPTRGSLILCRPCKQIINHSDLWDWPNWPKGILLSHWCLSSQSCKTTGFQTSSYLTIPSENFLLVRCKKDSIRKGECWFSLRASHPLFPLINFLFLPDCPAHSLFLCTHLKTVRIFLF